MKKIVLFISFLMCVFTMFGAEIKNEPLHPAFGLVNLEQDTDNDQKDGPDLRFLSADPDQSNKRMLTAGNVLMGVGIGFFAANCFLYFLVAMIAPPVLGSLLGIPLSGYGVLAGIMMTGFIPILGPFIGAGLVGYLSVTPPYSTPFSAESSNLGFYSGLIAAAVLMGLSEMACLAMMIAGIVLRARAKKKMKKNRTVMTVSPHFNQNLKPDGIRLALRIQL